MGVKEAITGVKGKQNSYAHCSCFQSLHFEV